MELRRKIIPLRVFSRGLAPPGRVFAWVTVGGMARKTMNGAVAAGHEVTVDAAAEVLKAGGNAFDAAIAGFFVACVAEPVLASPGGGGFLLAHESGGNTRVFDFFVQTPRRKLPAETLDFHPVMVDFGSAQQEFHIGLGAAAAPGCVRGMYAVHRELGRMPMRELLQPAIDAARAGLVLNGLQSYILHLVEPIYMTPSAARHFSRADGAEVLRKGDRLALPELADFLEVLGIEGEDLFYRGELARGIAEACAEGGGHLRRVDFDGYEVHQRRPLSLDYHGARVFTNPSPSSGGMLIGFGLSLLQECAVAKSGFGSYAHLRTLIEVLQQTSHARVSHADSDDLLAESLLTVYREQVSQRSAALRGTTHMSVVDGDGGVAALTVSNGEGCGTMVPGAGFMLNNMLGEEDLNLGGFHRWHENERMTSMMAPSLVTLANGDWVATGSGGSNRIRTALLQVISNLVDFGMDIEAAVASPRLHIEDSTLNVESGFAEAVVARLRQEFAQHRVFDNINLFFGGAHTVIKRRDQTMASAGDPRRSGAGRVL